MPGLLAKEGRGATENRIKDELKTLIPDRLWRAFAVAAVLCTLSGCARSLMSAGLVQPRPDALDARRDFDWVRDTTRHFLIRAEASLAGTTRDSLVTGLETSFDRVVKLFELEGSQEPVHAFAVSSRARVRSLLGRDVDGRAFFGTRVFAFSVAGDWKATSRHELSHVLLRGSWPGEPDDWISEGAATYAGDHFYGRDVHRLVAERLVATSRVLPLSVLARSFSGHPDEVTYLQSASVVKYIRERHGLDALRAAWAGGLSGLLRFIQQDLTTFERDWLRAVSAAVQSGT